jgi:flagellar motor protein MotB
MNAKTTTAVLTALAVLAIGAPVSAQTWGDPEGGDWGTQPDPNQQQQEDPNQQQQQQTQQQDPNQQQVQQQQTNTWQTQQTQQNQQQTYQQQQTTQQQEQPPAWGTNEEPVEGGGDQGTGDDHMDVAVGHLGVGFLGLATVPVGATFAGLAEPVAVSAPTIGVRYWLSEMIGLDVGVGFGFVQNSAELDSPDVLVSGNTSQTFALAIHGGLPIALFHAKHYKFNIIPELNLGYGTGTLFGATPNDDIELTGFSLEIGARAAAEIHFGFIGVPELALQAGVGLSLMFSSRNSEHTFGDPRGSTINSESSLDLGTRYNFDEPWDIFIGSLTALYYFR